MWNPRDGTQLKSIKTPGTVVNVAAFSEDVMEKTAMENAPICCITTVTVVWPCHLSEWAQLVLPYYGGHYREGHKYSVVKSCSP